MLLITRHWTRLLAYHTDGLVGVKALGTECYTWSETVKTGQSQKSEADDSEWHNSWSKSPTNRATCGSKWSTAIPKPRSTTGSPSRDTWCTGSSPGPSSARAGVSSGGVAAG